MNHSMDQDPARCPNCGSTQLLAAKKSFDPGWGCLGALLFGWWGLLLGLLGCGEVELTCVKCGHTFAPGGKARAGSGCGCGGCLLLILLGLLAYWLRWLPLS
jgi:DNA-directed RNA polymerase subunit RPC12/RpoP